MPLACSADATVPGTPVPTVGVVPAGTVSAGHTDTHAPVHALIPLWSLGKAYSAKPWALVSTVPKLVVVATSTVAPAAYAADDSALSTATAIVTSPAPAR